MPNVRQPRSGSMQFWPRKRAKRAVPRVRHKVADAGLAMFAGYKIGMTHVLVTGTGKPGAKKIEDEVIPVTLIACPPIKIAAIKLLAQTESGLQVQKEILVAKDKYLSKKLTLPKKVEVDISKISTKGVDELRLLVYTQPHLTATGKKKPDVFEVVLGGSIEDQLNFCKEYVGKPIPVTSVFDEGDLLDIHAITRGKGFQGPVKRFGISIRQAKSEKSIRNPGSLGPWQAQGHIMWRVAHAGKMGYHQRTEYNKHLLKVVDPKDLVFDGGIMHYGNPKSTVIMIKGSVAGPRKRLVVLQNGIRAKKKPVPVIKYISTSSKQGK